MRHAIHHLELGSFLVLVHHLPSTWDGDHWDSMTLVNGIGTLELRP